MQSVFYLAGYRGFRWTGLHAFLDVSKSRMAYLHSAVVFIFLLSIFLLGGHVSGKLPLSNEEWVTYLIYLWFIVQIVGMVCMNCWVQHKREDSIHMYEFLAECRAILSRLDMHDAAATAVEAEVQKWESTLVDLLQAMKPEVPSSSDRR